MCTRRRPRLGIRRHLEASGGIMCTRLGIWRDELIRDVDTVDDLDAAAHDRVVLHIRHRDEFVDSCHAEPVQRVRHQLLEAHILKTRRPSEVIRGTQRPSEVIRGHQRSSEVIRGHQRSSEALRGHQRSSEVIRGTRRPSEAISLYSVAIRPVRLRSSRCA